MVILPYKDRFELFYSNLKQLVESLCRDLDMAGKMVSQGIAVYGNGTSGDFLQWFWLDARRALHESGREAISLTIPDRSEFTIGVLIALFERAMGFCGSLVSVTQVESWQSPLTRRLFMGLLGFDAT